VSRAAVVGLSFGGGVAADFALCYPEMTRGLVLVAAAIEGWTWSKDWDDHVGPVWAAGRDGDVGAAKDRWLSLAMFAPAREKAPVARRLAWMVADYSGWHWQREDPQEHLQPPAMQRLGSIGVPTLVVVGERDVPDFRVMATVVAREITGSRQVVLAGVGHMVNMEDPGQFNALLCHFLDSL
jgi:pimeloyl-ACP methyl ester carboxylesterase